MTETFEKIRDAKLRREILQVLQIVRGKSPSGGLSGDALLTMAADGISEELSFESEGHFIGLCRDLVGAALAEQKDKGTRRVNESLKPKHLQFFITFSGTQLLDEKIPPVPGIYDGRAV